MRPEGAGSPTCWPLLWLPAGCLLGILSGVLGFCTIDLHDPFASASWWRCLIPCSSLWMGLEVAREASNHYFLAMRLEPPPQGGARARAGQYAAAAHGLPQGPDTGPPSAEPSPGPSDSGSPSPTSASGSADPASPTRWPTGAPWEVEAPRQCPDPDPDPGSHPDPGPGSHRGSSLAPRPVPGQGSAPRVRLSWRRCALLYALGCGLMSVVWWLLAAAGPYPSVFHFASAAGVATVTNNIAAPFVLLPRWARADPTVWRNTWWVTAYNILFLVVSLAYWGCMVLCCCAEPLSYVDCCPLPTHPVTEMQCPLPPSPRALPLEYSAPPHNCTAQPFRPCFGYGSGALGPHESEEAIAVQ